MACVNMSVWSIHVNHCIVFRYPLGGIKTTLLPGGRVHVTLCAVHQIRTSGWQESLQLSQASNCSPEMVVPTYPTT